MPYIIGVDVGGTFTDAFAADESGLAMSAKAPSTPPDFARGVINALEELAGQMDRSLNDLLSNTAYIAHGTTATLNALVTGNTSRVGFITTKGHRDSIYIMNLEGRYAGLGPEEIQNVTATHKPEPLVPKRHAKEVTERVDYKGTVLVALDEAEARQVIRELLADKVEAIAVSFLWSFRNPAHEQRIRELIREQGPTLKNYVVPLGQELKEKGLDGPLLIMQGSGGTVSAEEAADHAITTIGSVLTGGVVGSMRMGDRLGHKNIISTDVGGTTFLVGLLVDGQPVFSTSTILNQHIINVPMVRVNSIGSGGGAIAWVDKGQNLHVGPRSAGALPGPACYGQGGQDPTLTDADLMLGILNDKFFLGGRKPLDKGLANKALLEKIGEPLNMSADEAAAAVFSVQNAQTADLVRKVVVEAGYDPRDFVMYAFGGAGPVHCFAYGADVGVREIVVPLGSTAAAFSAYGLAASDVVLTSELSDPANYPVDGARATQNFERLENEVKRRLEKQGTRFSSISTRREVDIRYTLQMAEVSTTVKNGALSDADMAQVVDEFEARYATLFGKGAGFKEAGFQFITYRVFGTGLLPFRPTIPHVEVAANGTHTALKEKRPVFLDIKHGFVETPIYDYRYLAHGHVLEGPAVVEAPTTTVVVPQDATGSVDQLGNIVIRYS
ncbi:MAG: hydantoinase/oxoprolinase family protein [Chloroflexi bacterium]|nr:hydantoinase/oxoprolinase family protein [Chloroflexota bacterium]